MGESWKNPPHGVGKESHSARRVKRRARPSNAGPSQRYPPNSKSMVSDRCRFDVPVPTTNTSLRIGSASCALCQENAASRCQGRIIFSPPRWTLGFASLCPSAISSESQQPQSSKPFKAAYADFRHSPGQETNHGWESSGQLPARVKTVSITVLVT